MGTLIQDMKYALLSDPFTRAVFRFYWAPWH
jgi:hypothetical protein